MNMHYVTGGTMLPQALSYVVRDADRLLHDRLLQGEFCYVLTPRQMGKSSLMVRTAFALREQGVASAVLDLSKQGYSLDSAQWYNGLLEMLAGQLGLDTEMDEFCRADAGHSPLQRWHRALRDVVLERTPGPVVLFVDEIDITRRLKFETDEFFAAIRACYNARSEDAAYRRLTFCLMGVATPADLIHDPLLTPFNIGARIDLRDFTFQEAATLGIGLGRDEATNELLMARIYHWTHGHPYLTQRLCKAVAEDDAILTAEGVDRRCREIFLDPKAGSTEDNLTFVRRRLAVDDDQQRIALLTLYQQILSGKQIADNDADARVEDLKLSGAVRVEGGYLVPRNRIYQNVFDSHWVTKQMPDAELRRQRAAYRLFLLRATLGSAFVLLVISAFGIVTWLMYLRVREQREQLAKALEKVRDQQYLYKVSSAQRHYEADNYPTAFKLLERERPDADHPKDLRGFEWRYLWQQLQGDQFLFACPEMNVFTVAASPNGRIVAAGGQARTGKESTVRLWDIVTRREIYRFAYPGEVQCLAFSPDGKTLAAGGGTAYAPTEAGSVHLWDVKTGGELPPLSSPRGEVYTLAFTQDSRRLAVAGQGGAIQWWDLGSLRERSHPIKGMHGVLDLALYRDGNTLALSGDLGEAYQTKIYNPHSERNTFLTQPQSSRANSMTFSPDGRILAIGYSSNKVELWDVRTWRRRSMLPHQSEVHSVTFSPDGKSLAAACWDGTIRLWDVATRQLVRKLLGHVGRVNSVAFAGPEILVSGSNDGTVRVWNLDPKQVPLQSVETGGPVLGLALSDDGRTLATSVGGKILHLWNTDSGRAIGTLKEQSAEPLGDRFSLAGRVWVFAGRNGRWSRWMKTRGRAATGKAGDTVFSGESTDPLAALPAMLRRVVAPRKNGGLVTYLFGVSGLAIAPDGDTIAAIGHDVDRPQFGDGTLELWSLKSRTWLGAVRGASSSDIMALAFSPDGKTLATGGWDRRVQLWDVSRIRGTQDGRPGHRTITPIVELDDFGSQILSIAFSREQEPKTLAVGTEDHKISLVSLATGEVVAVLDGMKGHTSEVTSLAFSHDGNLLVSGSLDGTVHFWRAAPFSRTDDPQRVSLDAVWKH